MKRAWSKKNLWEATPTVIKSAVGGAIGAVPTPWLLGASFRKHYRFAADAQWWDEERARAYQFEQLKRVVTLAYEKTAYYRRSFSEVGFEPGDFKDISDLWKLPTIDRTTIQDHLDEMVAEDLHSGVDFISTSGSSGTPLGFYIQANRSAVEFAYLSQMWARVGYVPGARSAVLRGKEIKANRAGVHHSYDPLLHLDYFSTFHLTSDQMRSYLEQMHRARVEFIQAFPSSMYPFAKFVVDEGLEFPDSVKATLLESEPIHDYQREFFEEHVPGKVYSSYGHTEKLVMAGECEHSRAYHVWPTYGYCELLDEGGTHVGRGDLGEITGTGFINRVVPFIRFRTDDHAVYVGDGCAQCGRKHMIIDNMQAHRAQWYMVKKDGESLVSFSSLNVHDDSFDGVQEFQFVQRVAGEADLLIVPSSKGESYDAEKLKQTMERKLSGQMTITVRVCDEIERNKSGKRPVIKQCIPDVQEMQKSTNA